MTLVLRVGLLSSLALLLGSVVAYLLAHPGATSESALANNPILNYLNFPGLARGLAAGRIEAWMTLGLLVLLATPIVRVLSGVYYFHQDGERTMMYVTTTVFLLLLVGVLVIGPYIP
jgi:uncharacterized membrane protein